MRLPPFNAVSTFKAATLNYTEAQLKTMRAAYWGACAEAFNDVSRVIDTAQRTGHLNNTVVIFTSDHGEMSMEHRQDYKNSQREPSTRVPLVVAAYGAARSLYPFQGVVSNLSSHVDIVPTIAELVGSAPLPGVRGGSLVPFMQGGPGMLTQAKPHSQAASTRKDYVISEYHSNLANTGSFMVRCASGVTDVLTLRRTSATPVFCALCMMHRDRSARALGSSSRLDTRLIGSTHRLLRISSSTSM